MKKTPAQVGAVYGFRSGLEKLNADRLDDMGISYKYEEYKLQYEVPARIAKYTPDIFLPNGIIIETKGRFLTADRKKHLLIKEQCPGLDLRFVFSNPNTRISKTSKTTYAMWCESHGFLYDKKVIPTEWIEEPATEERIKAAIVYLKWNPTESTSR